MTLVFRNDPLESLKVSSTFDSIQFVRDYLQRTIEGKLRDLMMDELPAIIHRLSLQLWCPDQLPKEEDEAAKEDGEPAVDPLASPPFDAVDANGNLLDPQEIANLSLDGGAEGQSLFSQKNLLRLAALTNSQRTLSLFTPGIRDVMFRAWAGPLDRSDTSSNSPIGTPSLVKSHSFTAGATTYSFSDINSQDHGHLPSRPSLVSLTSATTGLHLGSSRHPRSYSGRRKKTRVVNLRKKTGDETKSEVGDEISDTTSVQGPLSEPLMTMSIPEEPEEDLTMPTISSPGKVRFRAPVDQTQAPPRPSVDLNVSMASESQAMAPEPTKAQSSSQAPSQPAPETRPQLQSFPSDAKTPFAFEQRRRGPYSDTSSVLEQAWIMKMAGEIARRVYDEKNRNGPGFWDEREEAPPAYEAH